MVPRPRERRRRRNLIVGVSKITIRLPENDSLKGKRRVVSSLTTKVRNKFNVSIAEVGDNDVWQVATLGVTCAANEARHVEEVLGKVMDFIERSRDDFEVIDQEMETLTGF